MGKGNLKIRQIIVLLFILLSVIPTTLLCAANMYSNNNRLESVMENDLRNTVSTQMKAINNFIGERRADAEIIVKTRLIQSILNKDGLTANQAADLTRLVNEILSLHVENSKYVESATVLDLDFRVVACSDDSAIGEVSSLKGLDSAYLKPVLTFTPVIETQRSSSRSRIIAAVQELYDGDIPAGYLVLELNLTFFEEIRDSARVYNNGTIYIIDGENNLVTAGDTVSAREEYVLSREEQADYRRAWQTRENNSGSGFLRYKAAGDHYLSYYSEFEDIDWTIISTVNTDDLLHKKESLRDLLLQIVLVLACLSVAVNLIFRHYLGQPIQDMILNFETIGRTRDFSRRMERSGCSEIATVSDGINSLLAGMEQCMLKEQEIRAGLKVKAERDPLTGLYNKEAFIRSLEEELKRAKDENTEIACLFLDIDDFKDFNTKCGHAGGDRVLIFIAEALRSQVGGLACRQGGDEFTVCIPDASDRALVKRKIRDLTRTLNHGIRMDEKGGLIQVRCSIGIVFSNGDTASAAELLSRSDEVMYEVKNDSKNGYKIRDL